MIQFVDSFMPVFSASAAPSPVGLIAWRPIQDAFAAAVTQPAAIVTVILFGFIFLFETLTLSRALSIASTFGVAVALIRLLGRFLPGVDPIPGSVDASFNTVLFTLSIGFAFAMTVVLATGIRNVWTILVSTAGAMIAVFRRPDALNAVAGWAALGVLTAGIVYLAAVKWLGFSFLGSRNADNTDIIPATPTPRTRNMIIMFWVLIALHLLVRLCVIDMIRIDPVRMELMALPAIGHLFGVHSSLTASQGSRLLLTIIRWVSGTPDLQALRTISTIFVTILQIGLWRSMRKRGLSPSGALFVVAVFSTIPGVMFSGMFATGATGAAMFLLIAFHILERARMPEWFDRYIPFDADGRAIGIDRPITIRSGVDNTWELSGAVMATCAVLFYPYIAILFPLMYFLGDSRLPTDHMSRKVDFRNWFWILPTSIAAFLFVSDFILHNGPYHESTPTMISGMIRWTYWLTPLLPLFALAMVFFLIQKKPGDGRRYDNRQAFRLVAVAAGLGLFFVILTLDSDAAYPALFITAALSFILFAEYARTDNDLFWAKLGAVLMILIGVGMNGLILRNAVTAFAPAVETVQALEKKVRANARESSAGDIVTKPVIVKIPDRTLYTFYRLSEPGAPNYETMMRRTGESIRLVRIPTELFKRFHHRVGRKHANRADPIPMEYAGQITVRVASVPLARYAAFTTDPTVHLRVTGLPNGINVMTDDMAVPKTISPRAFRRRHGIQ